MSFPTEPGYYWAKLKTPSGGFIYGLPNGPHRLEPEGEDWVSRDWEIVEVNQNMVPWDNKDDPEYFSVSVFGIPVTQWPLDFYWGPKVKDAAPVSHDVKQAFAAEKGE